MFIQRHWARLDGQMPKKKLQADVPPDRRDMPTISIYQNPDHVAGILQQAYGAGLLTEGTNETHQDRSSSTKRGGGGGGEVGAGFGAPMLVGARAKVSGDYRRDSTTEDGSGSKAAQNFVYSQAYYFYEVRKVLRDRGAITVVGSREDAQSLTSGDFVEYQATFQPNEIHALLDIFTPDLVAAISEHQVKDAALKGADDEVWSNSDKRQAFLQQTSERVKMRSDLARVVSEAVRVDFRSTKTREFYGTVGAGDSAVTAVTICDNTHFVVDDEDRILDGEFTVLGKVTRAVIEDLPVFERNKVLDRLNPEVVDLFFDQLRQLATNQITNKKGLLPGAHQLQTTGDVLDLALSSRVKGPSFKVIPVAIYA